MHFLQNFVCGAWWLFFPCHPAPLASAGVCITEKHNSVGSVQPFAERFCVMLVTTKVYSGEDIRKKRIFVGRV